MNVAPTSAEQAVHTLRSACPSVLNLLVTLVQLSNHTNTGVSSSDAVALNRIGVSGPLDHHGVVVTIPTASTNRRTK